MWNSKKRPLLCGKGLGGNGEVYFLVFLFTFLVCFYFLPLSRVAATVADFVAVELSAGMLDGSFVAGWHGAMVAVVDVKVVVDVATEVLRAVEPRACSDEDAIGEPLWTVVAIGGAGVGRVVVIAVRAHGGGSDADGDLRMCPGRSGLGEADGESEKTERLEESHICNLDWAIRVRCPV